MAKSKKNKDAFADMYKYFGVKNGEELEQLLYKDSFTVPCSVCGKEIDLFKASFPHDDPVCNNCMR